MVKSRGKRGGFDTSSTISLDGLSDEIFDNDSMVSDAFTDTSSRLTDSERPTTTTDTTATSYPLNHAFIEDVSENEVYITPDPNVDNEIFGDLTFGGSKRRTKRTKRKTNKRKTNKKRTSRRKRKTSRYYGGQPASSPSSNYTNRLTDTYRVN